MQQVVEVGVEEMQLALEEGDVLGDLPAQRLPRLAAERLQEPRPLGDEHLLHLLLAGEEVPELVLGLGRERAPLGLHARTEGGQHVGIQRVRLRELGRRLREVTHLARIHDDDRKTGTAQRGDDAALIPTRRFHHDEIDGRRGGQRLLQRVLARPGVRIGHALRDPRPSHHQLRLRHVDPQIALHNAPLAGVGECPCTRSVLYARSRRARLRQLFELWQQA